MSQPLRRLLISSCTFLIPTSLLLAQGRATPAITPGDATGRIVDAAQALVQTLDAAARAKLQFAVEGPQKTRWSNLPSGIFQREGLRMGDLTSAQRTAVFHLLEVALSTDGLRKVREIIQGDEVLKTGANGRGGGRAPGGQGGAGNDARGRQAGNDGLGRQGGRGPGGGPNFGEDEYYLAFLGTPSVKTPWMLQFGGHHLAINLTLAGSQASMTPSLPAAQPAKFTIEGREIRPLGKENDKAFALINALDAKQRSQAILGSRVADLVLGPGQDGRVIQPEGLRASAMTPTQQNMLLELMREWAGIMNDAFARPRMEELRANLPQTFFAWSGPTDNGSAAYFRVQGPTVVIEYAPQGSVDHIHTIYRDPTNDYGSKITGR